MLEVKHLSFSYGSHTVLKDISFSLAPGEIIGLLGANGTGKTTLMKVLATRFMQDTGTVQLNGVNPLETPLRYRRMVAYLPETCPLYPEMQVREYLIYRDKLKGERSLRVKRRVQEVMSACGLQDVSKTRIKFLSQGFHKRIGLADAMLRRPTVMLLDDLLPGLDLTHRKKAFEILTTVSARSAVLITGHEIHELTGLCTRFLVLSQGIIALSLRTAGLTEKELEEQLETALLR